MFELREQADALALVGDLDIYAVRDAKPALEAAQRVDLSQVEAIDGAGVQLLAWWRANDPGRELLAPSRAVSTACAAIGLGALLEPGR
jgi:ABC-type transporter Mla MlaB component